VTSYVECTISQSLSGTQNIDPMNIMFTDKLMVSARCPVLPQGQTCEAISDFSKSLNEKAVATPEPSTILSLLTIGGIALGASKKKKG
jgi:hypothetical protein